MFTSPNNCEISPKYNVIIRENTSYNRDKTPVKSFIVLGINRF